MEQQINFLLHIKLQSLKREGLEPLTYKQLKRVIYQTKWLLQVPSSISQIADDIESLTISEVAKYLTVHDEQLQKEISKLQEAVQSENFLD